jgi:hypothetical protein
MSITERMGVSSGLVPAGDGDWVRFQTVDVVGEGAPALARDAVSSHGMSGGSASGNVGGLVVAVIWVSFIKSPLSLRRLLRIHLRSWSTKVKDLVKYLFVSLHGGAGVGGQADAWYGYGWRG